MLNKVQLSMIFLRIIFSFLPGFQTQPKHPSDEIQHEIDIWYGKLTLERTERQKEGLIGNPKTRVWDSSRPSSNALFATSSDGQ